MAYQYGATRAHAGHNPLDAASTHNITGTGNTSPPEPAARRILNAAVELFGERGFTPVTLKEIADQAGVSAPLVIHHYGSKAGLRKACDRHVAELFRERKAQGLQAGLDGMARNYAFEAMQASQHLLRYLLRAFLAGGEEMDELFDHLVDDAVEYTDQAVEMGLVYPSRNQRNRVALMLMQQFGSLMMAHQMQRYFGFDPTRGQPEDVTTYLETIMELYTQPVINGEAYAALLDADRDAEAENDDAGPTPA